MCRATTIQINAPFVIIRYCNRKTSQDDHFMHSFINSSRLLGLPVSYSAIPAPTRTPQSPISPSHISTLICLLSSPHSPAHEPSRHHTPNAPSKPVNPPQSTQHIYTHAREKKQNAAKETPPPPSHLYVHESKAKQVTNKKMQQAASLKCNRTFHASFFVLSDRKRRSVS